MRTICVRKGKKWKLSTFLAPKPWNVPFINTVKSTRKKWFQNYGIRPGKNIFISLPTDSTADTTWVGASYAAFPYWQLPRTKFCDFAVMFRGMVALNTRNSGYSPSTIIQLHTSTRISKANFVKFSILTFFPEKFLEDSVVVRLYPVISVTIQV